MAAFRLVNTARLEKIVLLHKNRATHGINSHDLTRVNPFIKAAYSVTMNIFRKKKILFKSFVKVELSYVFTIKMFNIAENCMEK